MAVCVAAARAASSSSGQVSQTRGSAADVVDSYLLGKPPVWVQNAVWQGFVRRLGSLPFAASVLELCAGAGTASLALQLLLGVDKVRLAGAWDIDPALQGIHQAIHGLAKTKRRVHLGPHHGDILALDLRSFPSANILVAGPPCPPFSSCGKRMALGDPRAKPFERCLDILAELDSRAACEEPDRRDELSGRKIH